MATIIGFTNTARQAAALAKTNDTLVNTDLVIPIAVNQRMNGSFFAAFTLAGAASGAKFQLTVPAGGTIYQLGFQINDPATPAIITDVLLASAAFSDALAAADDYWVTGTFSITNGATAGNVALQFAQLVTDAGAATLLAGAWMWVTKF